MIAGTVFLVRNSTLKLSVSALRLQILHFLKLCAVLVFCAAPASALDPGLKLTQYARKTWTRQHGLPQNTVQAISQTADGFLWVGTQQGLVRFDGHRFEAFPIDTPSRAPEKFITSLFAEHNTLWIGTANGLFRMRDGRCTEILSTNQEPVSEVLAIHRDRSGRLWVGTLFHLMAVHENTASVFPGDISFVSQIIESDESGLCIAAGELLCEESGAFREVPTLAPLLSGYNIRKIAFSDSGTLWIATDRSRMFRLKDGETTHWDVGLADGWVQDVLVDRDGGFWFSYGAANVGRIDQNGVEFLPTTEGRSGGETLAVFEDFHGNIWLGTNSDGLTRLSATPITTYSTNEGLLDRSVRAVLQDRDGAVWIATAGYGLHRLAEGQISVVGHDDGLTSADVMTLAEDRSGRLWVGTAGSGVFVKENDHFTKINDGKSVVLSLHEDTSGTMWAGFVGGVHRFADSKFQIVEELKDVNAVWITSVDNSEVWFANALGGVSRWRDGRVTHLGKEQGIPGDMSIALHADKEGVWLGTHLGGLVYVRDHQVDQITSAHGLCDDSVFSITELGDGSFWMTSNIGVFTVPRSDLLAIVEGASTTIDCRLLSVADGLRSPECNGGQQPSAWSDQDGHIWFATVDGAARLNPEKLPHLAPPVIVDQILIDREAVSLMSGSHELELPSQCSEVMIAFTALDLSNAEQLGFRYRLDGLDTDWVETNDRRRASFSRLPPGRYRFDVQARIGDGSWGKTHHLVSFQKRPRFVETHWFVILVGMTVALVAGAAARTRISVLRQRQHRLEALVIARTRDLEEINNSLEQRVQNGIEALREKDRLAAYGLLVAGVAHEVRHPVFAVRAACHLLTQKLGQSPATLQELDILERETDRMSQLVDDLLELGRPRDLILQPCCIQELLGDALQSIRAHPDAGLQITMNVEDDLGVVLADRSAVIQILINLSLNACVHAASASTLCIEALKSVNNDAVTVRVSDDGEGISEKDLKVIFEPFFSKGGGTGLGLAIAHRLVAEHGSELLVRSSLGRGSVFFFDLPIVECR